MPCTTVCIRWKSICWQRSGNPLGKAQSKPWMPRSPIRRCKRARNWNRPKSVWPWDGCKRRALVQLHAETRTPWVSLTEVGRRYLATGSPAEWILTTCRQGAQEGRSFTVKDLQGMGTFQLTEFSRALGLLKKESAIRLASGGYVAAMETSSPTTEQFHDLLRQLSETSRAMQSFASDQQTLLRQYSGEAGKRSGTVFVLRTAFNATITLTETGKDVAKLCRPGAVEEISQLTPDVLKDGSWRKKPFRKYTITLRPPRVAPDGGIPIGNFLTRSNSNWSGWGFRK